MKPSSWVSHLLRSGRIRLSTPHAPLRERAIPPEIRNITAYIDQHYQEAISSETMARITGVTPHYFSEYFKKQCGICFCDYVNQVRLFRAMNLLDTTDLSIKEIAASVGFYSQAYFTRMFTRHFSLSPRDYRQKK